MANDDSVGGLLRRDLLNIHFRWEDVPNAEDKEDDGVA